MAQADLIITVTGARDVITPADLPRLKDGVIDARVATSYLDHKYRNL